MSWISEASKKEIRRGINVGLGSEGPEKEPNTARGLISIVYLVAIGMLIFASAPYITSFVHPGKVVGITKIDRKVSEVSRAIFNTSVHKKAYVRSGQGLVAEYFVPENGKLIIQIHRCKSRPILEVWKCKIVGNHDVTISEQGAGMREFTFSEAGFYYFIDHLIVNGENAKDYKMLWRRID